MQATVVERKKMLLQGSPGKIGLCNDRRLQFKTATPADRRYPGSWDADVRFTPLSPFSSDGSGLLQLK